MSSPTSMWAQDGLYVDVLLAEDGGLQFMGQDIRNFGDQVYEYVLTVAPDDVAKVTAALGGSLGDDVIALVLANAATIVRTEERSWLESLGIQPGLWSRMDG